jgi:hypothetical protein
MRTPKLLLASLLTVTALLTVTTAGCAAVAAGAAAVVISQDVLDNNVYVARLDRPAEIVWASAKVALSHLSPKPYDVQDDVRTAVADVDDAKVTVSVDTYDLNRSTLRVSARKYGVNNGEIAKMVYDRILQELDK